MCFKGPNLRAETTFCNFWGLLRVPASCKHLSFQNAWFSRKRLQMCKNHRFVPCNAVPLGMLWSKSSCPHRTSKLLTPAFQNFVWQAYDGLRKSILFRGNAKRGGQVEKCSPKPAASMFGVQPCEFNCDSQSCNRTVTWENSVRSLEGCSSKMVPMLFSDCSTRSCARSQITLKAAQDCSLRKIWAVPSGGFHADDVGLLGPTFQTPKSPLYRALSNARPRSAQEKRGMAPPFRAPAMRDRIIGPSNAYLQRPDL